MYVVRKCNKAIAVVNDYEAAMAIFRANKETYTWLAVIDATTDTIVGYWIY